MPAPDVLYQADSRWSQIALGSGPSTIGRGGCLLVCLTMAARRLQTRPALIPPHANKQFQDAAVYDGDRLRIHDAAPVLGLLAPLSERVTGQPGSTQIKDAVRDAFGADGLAILHVDYDGDKPGGDVEGDHFILAVEMLPSSIVCHDPAVGRVVLSWPMLEGLAVWGKTDRRLYCVVGVRPIRRVPQ